MIFTTESVLGKRAGEHNQNADEGVPVPKEQRVRGRNQREREFQDWKRRRMVEEVRLSGFCSVSVIDSAKAPAYRRWWILALCILNDKTQNQ
jgi:hypothetical protein